MKILIATFTFPPNKDGVSEASAVFARGFREAGWEVDVATLPVVPARVDLEWSGVQIHEFSISGVGRPGHPFRGEVEAYRAFLRGGAWDLIVFQSYNWPLRLAIGELGRLKGRKILVSHGNSALRWSRVSKFPWGLPAWAWSVWQSLGMPFWIRKFDRVTYLSEHTDSRAFFDHWIAKMSGYRGRRVIPNGVDLCVRGHEPAAFRREHGIGDSQLMFLCVANYFPLKDQGFAARAFRGAALRNAVLVFVGSEFNDVSRRFREEDESAPNEQRVGRIVWLEKVDRPSTLDAFAACDAFILSSSNEAQPISILEAMREAKPWICRDAGCIREMEGGRCVTTEEEMATAMQEFSENPDLRRSLGRDGRRAVEETYNLQHYLDSYLRMARELVMDKS